MAHDLTRELELLQEATQRLVRTVDGLHRRRLAAARPGCPAGPAPTWSPTWP